MKRKSLKSLNLNKKSISSLDCSHMLHRVNGGSEINCRPKTKFTECDDTSAHGCVTISVFETMTCPHWSCACPQE